MAKVLLVVAFLLLVFTTPLSAAVNATVPSNTSVSFSTTHKNMSWTITASSGDSGRAALWISLLPGNSGYTCTGNTQKANTAIRHDAPQQNWAGSSSVLTWDVLEWIHYGYSVESLIQNREITFDQSGDSYLCFEVRVFVIKEVPSLAFFHTTFTIVKLTEAVANNDAPIEGAADEVGGVFQDILPFNEVIFLATIISITFLRRKQNA
ncbi:hypothetical protein LCGC14_0302600 [marine sediment metagenome]|uniref:Uncharacterized protein n=1 Tax=marine sediment metagenome TaxID=412755 RepID=A0A0F9WVP1_9ZZZZ